MGSLYRFIHSIWAEAVIVGKVNKTYMASASSLPPSETNLPPEAAIYPPQSFMSISSPSFMAGVGRGPALPAMHPLSRPHLEVI